MFSMMKRFRIHSLAVRISVAYALLFGIVTCVGFIIIYSMIARHLSRTADADLLRSQESLAGYASATDLKALRKEFALDSAARGTETTFFRLMSPSGEELAASDMSRWTGIPADAGELGDVTSRKPTLKTVELSGKNAATRVLTVRVEHDRVLEIGLSLRDNERVLDKLVDVMERTLLLMLVTGSITGWVMARRAVVGVEKVTQAAGRIAEGHLDSAVANAGYGEEIEQLIESFNRMAVRIRSLVQEMKEVNDNIAHDLRSPLSRIRSLAEATLTAHPLPPEYEDPLGRIVEECDRLLAIVNTMLDISEAEAGVARLALEDVDLRAVAGDAVELFRPMAEAANVEISLVAEPLRPLRGDVRKLQRMTANLVDNAIKYTEPGGRVAVTVANAANAVRLSVEDTGIGIPAEEIPKVFNRFYRADRSRHLPGNGLGLCLANAIARLHGGSISVSSNPGKGSTFTVHLPCAPSAA
jgi:signal transduction histidine kinase